MSSKAWWLKSWSLVAHVSVKLGGLCLMKLIGLGLGAQWQCTHSGTCKSGLCAHACVYMCAHLILVTQSGGWQKELSI